MLTIVSNKNVTLAVLFFCPDNIPESNSSSETELKKEAPVIPPRPSAELILERCTDKTRKRVSVHGSPTNSVS